MEPAFQLRGQFKILDTDYNRIQNLLHLTTLFFAVSLARACCLCTVYWSLSLLFMLAPPVQKSVTRDSYELRLC
jgi:hypothetical protein